MRLLVISALYFALYRKYSSRGLVVLGSRRTISAARSPARTGRYLVDRSGSKVLSFGTRVEPDDPKLVAAIERLLQGR